MSKSIREQLIELGLAKPPAVKPTNTVTPAQRPEKGYLDEHGNALCPICSQRIPYSQLDGHISDVHGNHLLGYYGNLDRGGDVRAKFVSGGGSGTGKRR